MSRACHTSKANRSANKLDAVSQVIVEFCQNNVELSVSSHLMSTSREILHRRMKKINNYVHLRLGSYFECVSKQGCVRGGDSEERQGKVACAGFAMSDVRASLCFKPPANVGAKSS